MAFTSPQLGLFFFCAPVIHKLSLVYKVMSVCQIIVELLSIYFSEISYQVCKYVVLHEYYTTERLFCIEYFKFQIIILPVSELHDSESITNTEVN